MISPYMGLMPDQWKEKTLELIATYPFNVQKLYDSILTSWDDIFSSSIGLKSFRFGVEFTPTPQIMGFFLHELIALNLQSDYPELWRKGLAHEKDIVYMPDDMFSIEIKTSSSGRGIFGNRSYAQPSLEKGKSKSGYYLTVNFEKFSTEDKQPRISLVRFGWIDHQDWIGQQSQTGQQARLSPSVLQNKLIELPIKTSAAE